MLINYRGPRKFLLFIIHKENINYQDTVKNIIKNDGLLGLFGRGLKTRILTNGIQGILFTICWKYIEETINKKNS